MNNVLQKYWVEILTTISAIFSTGGVGYLIISRIINNKKYKEEARLDEASADIKGDEFWKNRYDVLKRELDDKDKWWKERYDNLYDETQKEKSYNNELVKSFREELIEIRNQYEEQRTLDRQKYERLMSDYREFQESSEKKRSQLLEKISELEKIICSFSKEGC